ncbi:MAG: sodium:alanine symporter family protein [Ruminococcus sp.]|nr:sodium:alanine symporter family protein [Ruminococcus sp.]
MLEKISDMVWSGYTLAFILAFGGWLTVKTRFFQLRRLRFILKNTVFSLFSAGNSENSGGGISQKGAFCSVLAATMGTGNIIGVASAIAIGGAGAVFWMWVSAILGMMAVYAENYFGSMYRKKDRNGNESGGAMYYIEAALNRPAAVIYAVLCVFASLGMGNMVQTNSLSAAVSSQTGISPVVIGIIASFLCGLVIIGGIDRISSVAEILIPLISGIYILASLFIISKNFSVLPDVFEKIFSEAFGIKAAGGGISGALIKKAVSVGMKRGVFSNEAGLGTSSMFHSHCAGRSHETQGIWGISEVFADTMICCTLTALAILCSAEKGVKISENSTALITDVFCGCFGKYSGFFISILVSLFAFATLVGWSHCGESAFSYVFGKKECYIYKFIYCLAAYTGAVLSLKTVWTLSDIFNGLMIIPNITALILLCRKKSMNTP